MKNSNIFTSFLHLLNIRYTDAYSNKYFNEHPYKYTLYGLSNMLSEYGIENAGLQINDKNDLLEIETPFVAHVSVDFAVIYKITKDQVYYIVNGKKTVVSIEDFYKVWNGVVLIAEPDENSIEPDFIENSKKEWINKFQKHILYAAIALLIVSVVFISDLYKNTGLLLLLAANLTGFYVSYLLVLKQLNIHSSHSDKICSLFKQADCNNILESKAARIWGIIGWSEIGLGYFITNTLIILFFQHLLSYMSLLNICALVYTCWSIWYQKFKAKQWCPLCLIVQIIFLMTTFIHISFHFISIPTFGIDFLFAGSLYIIPMLFINLLVPQLGLSKKVEQITQELKSIKSKDEVFQALIHSQPHYDIGKSTSHILFGNKYSDHLITIVTNPHCEPCARLHEKVTKLIHDTKNMFCFQYIFMDFEGMEDSSRYLTGIYYNYDAGKVEEIYTEWFNKGGKQNRELFYSRYPVNNTLYQIEDEITAHQNWQNQTHINSTPTIFINGFQLPSLYQLEELSLLDFVSNH